MKILKTVVPYMECFKYLEIKYFFKIIDDSFHFIVIILILFPLNLTSHLEI